VALLKGKQIATGADGVNTANIVDGALAASAAGRAKMATNFFDTTTTTDAKFAAGSIGLDRLEEAVIQADGGQAFTADQAMGSNKLTGLANGTAAGDAVNLSQLQGVSAGISWKEAVKAATDNAITDANTYANGTAGVGATITADANGAWDTNNSDGVTLIVGDRLLVKDETAGDAPNNGIYEVTDLGSAGTPWILTRVTDCDESAEIDSAAIFVQQGATHADQGWTQTADAPTMGTTAISWTQFTGTGGITFGTPGAIEPDDAAAEGVASSAARSDHTHSIVAAAPGATQLGAAAAEGSATSFARSDHVHKANTVADTIQPDDTAAVGTSQDMARADHTHGIVTAAPGATQLGAAAGEGAATSFARSDHVHKANTAASALGAAAAIGTSQDIARADHVHKYLTRNVETLTTEAITGADTAMADTLTNTPIGSVAVYLNGMLQQEGAGNDYTISGSTITWLASTGTAVDQETTDEMQVIYWSA
jgi:hypothetical protein